MQIGLGLALTNLRGGGFSPATLFRDGSEGVWYDPSDLSTMFQDSAGTQPVTTPGQPVGLLLDKSQGLKLGPELVFDMTQTQFDNWTDNGDGTFTSDGGDGFIGNATVQTGMTANATYEVQFEIVNYISGSVRPQSSTPSGGVYQSSVGVFKQLIVPSTIAFYFYSNNFAGTIRLISIREVPGHHASQATASKRPTYRDSGSRYLQDDLVDDVLNWTAPADSYTIIYGDTDGTITTLTAQALSGTTDVLQTENLVGYIAINRALTSAEQSRVEAYLRSKAA